MNDKGACEACKHWMVGQDTQGTGLAWCVVRARDVYFDATCKDFEPIKSEKPYPVHSKDTA